MVAEEGAPTIILEDRHGKAVDEAQGDMATIKAGAII